MFANISLQIPSVSSHSCPQPNAKPVLLSLRSQITCGGRPQPVSWRSWGSSYTAHDGLTMRHTLCSRDSPMDLVETLFSWDHSYLSCPSAPVTFHHHTILLENLLRNTMGRRMSIESLLLRNMSNKCSVQSSSLSCAKCLKVPVERSQCGLLWFLAQSHVGDQGLLTV